MVDLEHGFAAFADNLERPVLSVLLDVLVIEGPTDHSLGVKNGVGRILSGLVLGGISDQTFVLGECDPRGRDSVSLVVGDNLDFSTSLDTT